MIAYSIARFPTCVLSGHIQGRLGKLPFLMRAGFRISIMSSWALKVLKEAGNGVHSMRVCRQFLWPQWTAPSSWIMILGLGYNSGTFQC